jgi:hypothetical protein
MILCVLRWGRNFETRVFETDRVYLFIIIIAFCDI